MPPSSMRRRDARGLSLAVVIALCTSTAPSAHAAAAPPCTGPGIDGVSGTADDTPVDGICGVASVVAETRNGPQLTAVQGSFLATHVFPTLAGSADGGFDLRSAFAGADLRSAPGTIRLDLGAGKVEAVLRDPFSAWLRDPVTGAPLAIAPGAPAPNQALFDQICDTSRGFTAIDRTACLLTLFNSQVVIPQIMTSVATIVSILTAGQPPFADVIFGGFSGAPGNEVPLIADPADGGTPLQLDGVLTDAQESIVGCGALFGTSCDTDGMSVFRMAPSALFPCFSTGDASDTSHPQPCTTTAATPLAPLLAGARGPADAAYDPSIDGSSTPLQHPLAVGQQFRSETAALAWDLQGLLVAFSYRGAAAPVTPGSFDPARPLRLDGCSWARPDLCSIVAYTRNLVVSTMPDEPTGGPSLRWLWELGAAYEVTSATQSLCSFVGGTLSASGPYTDGPGSALSIFLARSASPPPPSPFPDFDCDGIPDASDNCPYTANTDQADTGGIGAGSAPDGLGDVCQCGDVSADGRVTTADAVLISRALLQPPTATLAQPERCNVGGSAICSAADAVILRRALLSPATAIITQVCAPALP